MMEMVYKETRFRNKTIYTIIFTSQFANIIQKLFINVLLS